jgi:hypothetical protein
VDGHQLAQMNVARMKAPLDHALMESFRAQLDTINAIADDWPGFVWRLQDEDGDATSIRVFDDALILVNMSVWESADALYEYVYRSAHLGLLRDRREWFEPMGDASVVLWWVAAGHIPTPEEGRDRLHHLRAWGATAHAFTFKSLFDPPAIR